MSEQDKKKRVPVRDGIFATPLSVLEKVHIAGSKCRNCGEVTLGTTSSCPNCAGEDMEVIPLGRRGKLWTYTIIYHRPPGDYKGPDPFVPFGEGLVEVPEGIRVLAPLEGDVNKIKIGTEYDMVAHVLYTNADGNEVIAFKFRPVEEAR